MLRYKININFISKHIVTTNTTSNDESSYWFFKLFVFKHVFDEIFVLYDVGQLWEEFHYTVGVIDYKHNVVNF